MDFLVVFLGLVISLGILGVVVMALISISTFSLPLSILLGMIIIPTLLMKLFIGYKEV